MDGIQRSVKRSFTGDISSVLEVQNFLDYYNCCDEWTKRTYFPEIFKLCTESEKNSYAQNWLGHMYRKGITVDRDDVTAAAFFEASAKQNNSFGECNLGLMELDKGIYKKAMEYFAKSVDHGNPLALFWLGYMYVYGCGISVDNEKGIGLLIRSLQFKYDYGKEITIKILHDRHDLQWLVCVAVINGKI